MTACSISAALAGFATPHWLATNNANGSFEFKPTQVFTPTWGAAADAVCVMDKFVTNHATLNSPHVVNPLT
jgi:hypothetical protein